MNEDDIIKGIQDISGKYNPQMVFNDWIHLACLSISCFCKDDEEKENEYKSIASKYTSEELKRFSEFTGMLTLLIEQEIKDYLGSIFMRLESGSARTGQFFTPFHLSVLTSEVGLSNFDGEPFIQNEPSCGGGGMILATTKVLLDRGYNPQHFQKVIAQDLDANGVYMTYLQCSLLGLRAKVIQGNTLTNEKNDIWYTPMYLMMGDRF